MSKEPEIKIVSIQNIADTGGVVNAAALIADPTAAATSSNSGTLEDFTQTAVSEATSVAANTTAAIEQFTTTAASTIAQDSLMPSLNAHVAPVVVNTGEQAEITIASKSFANRNNPAAVFAAANATAKLANVGINVGANGNIVRQSPQLARAAAARESQKNAAIELDSSLQRILEKVPGANQSEIIRIRQYCVAMAPGRAISEEAGAQQQVALYRSLQIIINRQTAYFTPLFTAVLKIFQSESNGALADTHRNRFESHVVLSREDRKAFRNITHLLSVVADPKGRALALRTINLEAALANGLTEEGRNRVINHLT